MAAKSSSVLYYLSILFIFTSPVASKPQVIGGIENIPVSSDTAREMDVANLIISPKKHNENIKKSELAERKEVISNADINLEQDKNKEDDDTESLRRRKSKPIKVWGYKRGGYQMIKIDNSKTVSLNFEGRHNRNVAFKIVDASDEHIDESSPEIDISY